MLIHAQKAGQLIRRLFDGSNTVLLGELLQNAQRAGATRVDFTFEPTKFSMRDNGSGLCVTPDPSLGFNALLRIAESLYTNPEVQAHQKPMGVGINALLGHESAETVTFRSNGYQVTLNLESWWTEIDETDSWRSLIQPDTHPITGFEIEATGQAQWIEDLQTALKTVEPELTRAQLNPGPAQGYEGLLEIYCNGTRLIRETQSPQIPPSLQQFTRTYQNCPVTFYVINWRSACHVMINWYGQLITQQAGLGHVGLVMKVTQGTPVNPKAPTRDGLIQDRQLQAWKQWIEDTLFDAVATQSVQATPDLLKSLCNINPRRFETECPFFIASEIEAYQGGTGDESSYHEQVFAYDNAPLVLENQLEIWVPDLLSITSKPWSQWNIREQSGKLCTEYGLASFVNVVGQPCYKLTLGNRSRLSIQTLQWQSGNRIDEASDRTGISFYEPGEWGMVCDAQPEPNWQPITQSVFGFADTSSGFDDIEWVFGTTNPVECLEENAWAAFCAPEEDAQLAADAYDESLDETIRQLLPNTIPGRYNQAILESHIQQWQSAQSVVLQGIRFTDQGLLVDAIVDSVQQEIPVQAYGSGWR